MAMKVNLKLTSISEVEILLEALTNLESSSVIKSDLMKRLNYLKAQIQKLDPNTIKNAAARRDTKRRNAF